MPNVEPAVIHTVIPTETALRERLPGTYVVNECFYTVQGEGVQAGRPMVFVRFADCNLRCTWKTAGFDCDTEFMSGRQMTARQIVEEVAEACGARHAGSPWVLFTGGEPALQLDLELLAAFRRCDRGTFDHFAIETNGTVKLPDLDPIQHGRLWVCVSPKSAEHTLRQLVADEVKYVRHAGQALPQTRVKADHYLVSPSARPDGSFAREDVSWCVRLAKENPTWRLSLQLHKLLSVR